MVVPTAMPSWASILATLRLVNDHWIGSHADPGNNLWNRATYMSGNLALHRLTGDVGYLRYAETWAAQNDYQLNGGPTTRHADNHCAGQVYLELDALAPDPAKVQATIASLDAMVHGPLAGKVDDWWWVDALHMAMPTFVRGAARTGDDAYLSKVEELYRHTKSVRKLYAPEHGLWYRDGGFRPPAPGATSPNGKPVLWSRGNGWAFAALAKVLALIPRSKSRWPDYEATLRAMASSLRTRQRSDGFWNVNLADPAHFGGPETSGTAFFVYGLAYGMRSGRIDLFTYLPVAARAWNGMVATAVQSDGFLGHVQGTGSSPSSSQPVTASSTADFGVGAFLLAGSELAQLAWTRKPRPRTIRR